MIYDFEVEVLSCPRCITAPKELLDIVDLNTLEEKLALAKKLSTKYLFLAITGGEYEHWMNAANKLIDEYEAELHHRKVTFDEPLKKYYEKVKKDEEVDNSGDIEMREFSPRMSRGGDMY